MELEYNERKSGYTSLKMVFSRSELADYRMTKILVIHAFLS